jgi:hypothetical protein
MATATRTAPSPVHPELCEQPATEVVIFCYAYTIDDPGAVLLFDVFGTLVDWRSSLIEIAQTTATRSNVRADWAGIVDDWRRAISPRWTGFGRVRPGAISIPSSAARGRTFSPGAASSFQSRQGDAGRSLAAATALAR